MNTWRSIIRVKELNDLALEDWIEDARKWDVLPRD
tara:strand:- start:571 stop:675 length:105 start_codon:yes stop_codon:yes gene_type:complete